MIYVPIKTDAAATLSAQIYQLTRPLSVREPTDVSLFYCGWIVHPTRPEVSTLELPGQETIPIHLKADAESLGAMLLAFVATGEITQAEVDGIMSAVTQQAGQSVNVASLIPTSWQQYVMTREQAEAAGWIPVPTIPS